MVPPLPYKLVLGITIRRSKAKKRQQEVSAYSPLKDLLMFLLYFALVPFAFTFQVVVPVLVHPRSASAKKIYSII